MFVNHGGDKKSRKSLEDLALNSVMDLMIIVWEVVDWIQPAQDKGRWRTLVNTVINILIPCKARNVLTNCTTISCDPCRLVFKDSLR